jgi:hypothetical protein
VVSQWSPGAVERVVSRQTHVARHRTKGEPGRH